MNFLHSLSAEKSFQESLSPFMPQIIPLLLSCMEYSNEHLTHLELDSNSNQNPNTIEKKFKNIGNYDTEDDEVILYPRSN